MRRRRGRAARGQARGRNEARRAADGARQEHSKHPEHFAHSSWTTSGYDCPRTPVRGQLQPAADEVRACAGGGRSAAGWAGAGGRAGGHCANSHPHRLGVPGPAAACSGLAGGMGAGGMGAPAARPRGAVRAWVSSTAAPRRSP